MSNCSVKGEDEEELESLRLAALESLRAKGLPPPTLISIPTRPIVPTNQVIWTKIENYQVKVSSANIHFLPLGFSTPFRQPKFDCHHSS